MPFIIAGFFIALGIRPFVLWIVSGWSGIFQFLLGGFIMFLVANPLDRMYREHTEYRLRDH